VQLAAGGAPGANRHGAALHDARAAGTRGRAPPAAVARRAPPGAWRENLLPGVAGRAVGIQHVVAGVEGDALREKVDGLVVVLGRERRVALGLELVGRHAARARQPKQIYQAAGAPAAQQRVAQALARGGRGARPPRAEAGRPGDAPCARLLVAARALTWRSPRRVGFSNAACCHEGLRQKAGRIF